MDAGTVLFLITLAILIFIVLGIRAAFKLIGGIIGGFFGLFRRR